MDEHTKRYIKKGCRPLNNCSDVLSSNEALKHFAEMWGKYKADTMIMLTAIEYEFISKEEFDAGELNALRYMIGNTGKFFKGCYEEYQAQLERERLRIEKESVDNQEVQ